jgi:putative transposase
MKRSKFWEAQIAFILRQGEEGTAVGEVCRKAGISEATYYSWRKKYGGLMPSDMKPARGRERQAEEDRGRSVAGQGDAAGRHPPKALKPARTSDTGQQQIIGGGSGAQTRPPKKAKR